MAFRLRGTMRNSIVVLFVSLMAIVSTQAGRGSSRTETLDKVISQTPDISKPPNYDSDEPVNIYCSLYVDSFDSINEANMDFTVSILLHLEWRETRIQKSWRVIEINLNATDYLEVDSQNMQKIWVPDLFFPNEKKASYHNIMLDNRMLRIYYDGTVSYTTRLSMTLNCPMHLQSFPFDQQNCSITTESFGYTSAKLKLQWKNVSEPVMVNNEIELPQFVIKEKSYNHATKTHKIRGERSALQAHFILVRNITYYVIQMYIPSLLIVMLSWVSFWLNVNSVPGRISLGVLSVLTISTQSSSVNASLPRVSYTKAVDVWMATCLVFVFAALIEFAIANWLSRTKDVGKKFKKVLKFRKLRKKQRKDDPETAFSQKDTVLNIDGGVKMSQHGDPRSAMYSSYLDNASRILFPVAFTVFNITYWTYYSN